MNKKKKDNKHKCSIITSLDKLRSLVENIESEINSYEMDDHYQSDDNVYLTISENGDGGDLKVEGTVEVSTRVSIEAMSD